MQESRRASHGLALRNLRIVYNSTITANSSQLRIVAGLLAAAASGCRGLYNPITRITAFA
jgi:hypothetical protein